MGAGPYAGRPTGEPKGTRLAAAKLKCKPFAALIRRAVNEVDGMPMERKSYASLLASAVVLGMAGAASDCRAAVDWGAAGSNWNVMLWTDALTVSIDTTSITPHATRVVAHVMWDYFQARTAGTAAAAPYKSMMGVLVFDCATLRFGGAGSVFYSGDGGDGDPVAQYSIDPDSAALSASEPGTIGSDLAAYVCAHAQSSKR
jgi:hypothetical protein